MRSEGSSTAFCLLQSTAMTEDLQEFIYLLSLLESYTGGTCEILNSSGFWNCFLKFSKMNQCNLQPPAWTLTFSFHFHFDQYQQPQNPLHLSHFQQSETISKQRVKQKRKWLNTSPYYDGSSRLEYNPSLFGCDVIIELRHRCLMRCTQNAVQIELVF